MLKIFWKEDLNELLEKSGLSKMEEDLIKKSRKVFDLEIELLEIRMDPYFTKDTVNFKDLEEYKEFNRIVKEINSECISMIKDMKEKRKFNYKFLDLLLYSSIYVYEHISEYGIKNVDEFVSPSTKIILENFWADINEKKFPVSCEYFMKSLNSEILSNDEYVVDTSNLITCSIGKIFNCKDIVIFELERKDVLDLLESYKYLMDSNFAIKLLEEDLRLLEMLDFNDFKISNLNTIMLIPSLIFNKYNEVYQCTLNNSLIKTVIKKVFEYLSVCSKYLNSKRDDFENLPVDEYDYENNQLIIKGHFDKMPLEYICQYYSELEFESNVNLALRELLDIAYYRDYKKNMKWINDKLQSKEHLEMKIDIPF